MDMMLTQAPEFATSQWFNTDKPISLSDLRGRVVVIEAFQMLCPGCVSHTLPQAQTIQKAFSADEVAVIGLHTVFEHHAAMTPTSLKAFLHEYRIEFPVGVDLPSKTGGIPQTMARYQLRGTPSTILIDRKGRIRKHKFGQEHDLVMGAEITSLLLEPIAPSRDIVARNISEHITPAEGCNEEGCFLP